MSDLSGFTQGLASRLRRSQSSSRDNCSSYPTVDCFTNGFRINKNTCRSFGCMWCPKPHWSKDPWCITGEERPRECKINTAVDCFDDGSQVTKKMCDAMNCYWCPKKKGPWCVKAIPEDKTVQNLSTVVHPVCGPGTVRRYKEEATCCVIPSSHSCGTLTPERRIVGGYLSAKGSWPWLIHFIPYPNTICGAVLIGARYAITAGHCVYGTRLHKMVFSFGIHDSWELSLKRLNSGAPKRTMVHPDFKHSPRLVNDIAFVEFKAPVKFSSSINAICLPNTENPPVGSKCFIAGWGATAYGGYSSRRLREAQIYILEGSVCLKAYGPTFDTEKMICAGHLDGKADSCLGDSGGPLMCQRCASCKWYVAALVSYGKGCGLPDHPGVYSRVSAYENWLKDEGVIRKVGTAKSCELHQLI